MWSSCWNVKVQRVKDNLKLERGTTLFSSSEVRVHVQEVSNEHCKGFPSSGLG
ncbi:hypothetical protein FA13DRAFT_230905 [Coprinellus micaceus]|uniref:Uncharacterized protein n=1 Tax=Coprinellus micaceus TaxID=71717 RepID=A0A4Y7TFE2_COPMI|nr:hypothetical protein FA13DRAFT_230905 [Coprinellus micaceus]